MVTVFRALDWNINRGTVGYTGGRDWKPADAPGDTQVMFPQNVIVLIKCVYHS